jgi:hypothetical protein
MSKRQIKSKHKHKHKHKKSHKMRNRQPKQQISDEEIIQVPDDENMDGEILNDEHQNQHPHKLADKSRIRLKAKIIKWLDNDDKIKDLNKQVKKYKVARKEQEDIIIKMLTKLGMETQKIDVHNENDDQFRGRVYRHKSVTKGTIKEGIIKKALMEAIRDEKKVDQLLKKIDNNRSITERYYLKRTKGNKQE